METSSLAQHVTLDDLALGRAQKPGPGTFLWWHVCSSSGKRIKGGDIIYDGDINLMYQFSLI
jgi:hypothetical protein